MIKLVLVPLLLLLSYVMFNLGFDWINFGYGLHPAIALPISGIAAVAALAVYVSFVK